LLSLFGLLFSIKKSHEPLKSSLNGDILPNLVTLASVQTVIGEERKLYNVDNRMGHGRTASAATTAAATSSRPSLINQGPML
jgi:hypothetical protein